MPPQARKQGEPPTSSGGSLADQFGRLIAEQAGETSRDRTDDNPFGWVDIITFIESPYFLAEKLYTWQKIIFKIFYMGTPGNRHLHIVDDPTPGCTNCVWIGNDLNRLGRSPCLHCIHYDDELRARDVEVIRSNPILHEDRKDTLLNAGVPLEEHFENEMMLIERDLPTDSDARAGGSVVKQVIDKIGHRFSELYLVLGRRSGKSQMAAWLGLYEVYRLIEMSNPQRAFGMTDGSLITVLNVAVAAEQAEKAVFSKVRAAIDRSPYFKTKVSAKSLLNASVKFMTPYDEEENRRLESQGFPARDGTIQFVSGHSKSSSQVGLNIPVVIMDEMAQMVNKDGSSMSDAELYTQLKNSVWTFPDFKIVCISNPLTRDGKFYELYEESFVDERCLMFQLPSYKANPGIPDEILEEERRAAMRRGSMSEYQMQIEARFIGGAANPLVPAQLVDEAFERGYRMVRLEYGDPRQSYYMHLDPAVSSDNYAMAIVHVEADPIRASDTGDLERVVFVDHVQMWEPDRVQGVPIDIAMVEQYVFDICQRFHIVSITADQWNSVSSLQNFQRHGIQAKQTPFNPTYVQKIYTNLVELFVQGRIVFYSHGPYVPETMDQMKFLQQKFNRRTWRIEAAEGHYDDIPACIAGASYVALTGQIGYRGLPSTVLVRADWARSGSISGGGGGGGGGGSPRFASNPQIGRFSFPR